MANKIIHKKEDNEKMKKISKLIPDTSVIIEGLVSRKIEEGFIMPETILINEAVIAELEHQANENKETGFIGLDEINNLSKLAEKNKFKIEYVGKRPEASEIKYAKLGEIDSMIREIAQNVKGTLITADRVQAAVAQTRGIDCIFIEFELVERKLRLAEFFDDKTMSVHLRENLVPFAKKGIPGNWKFEKVNDTILTREFLQELAKEIVEEARLRKDSFVEIERRGSTVVQLEKFRTVITKPPFSDAWEITAVRPVKILEIEDYNLDPKIVEKLTKNTEGVLIAGSPGMGKSTFAQALAEFYAKQGKIVKTVEAPRDLILSDNITQYSVSHGNSQEIHDVLLLSRPDYTIFDEMRNTEDFRLFTDLRLSGVGMVGVIHATNPIDGIQRFIGRIELGVIPQVIDTVLFILNGTINKIFNVKMEVRVPTGMTEADLARPVVSVSDFKTGKTEFEIYSYGEETVVVPVAESSPESPAKKLAAQQITREMQKYADYVKVEVVSDNKAIVYVPDHAIAGIIGKQGKNIEKIEDHLGISLDIRELQKNDIKPMGNEIDFDVKMANKYIVLMVDEDYINKDVDIYINNELLLSVKVGKNAEIKIKKNNNIGKTLLNAIEYKEELKLVC
jgi:ATPase